MGNGQRDKEKVCKYLCSNLESDYRSQRVLCVYNLTIKNRL